MPDRPPPPSLTGGSVWDPRGAGGLPGGCLAADLGATYPALGPDAREAREGQSQASWGREPCRRPVPTAAFRLQDLAQASRKPRSAARAQDEASAGGMAGAPDEGAPLRDEHRALEGERDDGERLRCRAPAWGAPERRQVRRDQGLGHGRLGDEGDCRRDRREDAHSLDGRDGRPERGAPTAPPQQRRAREEARDSFGAPGAWRLEKRDDGSVRDRGPEPRGRRARRPGAQSESEASRSSRSASGDEAPGFRIDPQKPLRILQKPPQGRAPAAEPEAQGCGARPQEAAEPDKLGGGAKSRGPRDAGGGPAAADADPKGSGSGDSRGRRKGSKADALELGEEVPQAAGRAAARQQHGRGRGRGLRGAEGDSSEAEAMWTEASDSEKADNAGAEGAERARQLRQERKDQQDGDENEEEGDDHAEGLSEMRDGASEDSGASEDEDEEDPEAKGWPEDSDEKDQEEARARGAAGQRSLGPFCPAARGSADQAEDGNVSNVVAAVSKRQETEARQESRRAAQVEARLAIRREARQQRKAARLGGGAAAAAAAESAGEAREGPECGEDGAPREEDGPKEGPRHEAISLFALRHTARQTQRRAGAELGPGDGAASAQAPAEGPRPGEPEASAGASGRAAPP
ncbi:unnamed protein product, partial [Prorocentrum cordatum]